MKTVLIFVEGGSIGKEMAFFRKEFQGFLSKGIGRLGRLKVIACGSRGDTYKKYMSHTGTNPHEYCILLVDSEGPVTKSPWEHLCDTDQWRITVEHDVHCHLMVQMMESWFLADIDALSGFYGPKFHSASLPKSRQVKSISKRDIEECLKKATRNTLSGEYHKTRHAPKLLSLLDPTKVRAAAPHCERLFSTLSELIGTDS